MAKILLAIGMIVACTASAASSPGASSAAEWDTGAICTSGTSGEHCGDYQSTLTMWSINGEICGSISETSARRSPEAWFRGRPYREGILVRYVESFQRIPGDYGWAVIKMEGDRLSWAVLKSPEGSYIESEARLKPTITAEVPMTTARSCSDWEAERSGLTVHLPLDEPREVGNR